MPDNHGMICLYPDQKNQTAQAATTFDIVAVHGFDGDRIGTWKHKGSGSCWLSDFLPQDIEKARVLSYGYTAGLGLRATKTGMDDIAKGLLSDVAVKRRRFKETRPVVFVAHSLGGLVVKLALNKAYAGLDTRYKAIVTSTAGILFFGTPHQGADLASFAVKIDNIISFVAIQPKSTILKNMERDCDYLRQINDDFRGRSEGMTICSFYELGVSGPGKTTVVDKDSALFGYGKEGQFPIEADHSNMCKFGDSENMTYQNVVMRIEDMLEKVSGKFPEESSTPNSTPERRLLMGPKTRVDNNAPAPPGALEVFITEEEREAIDRLCRLGFERDIVIQAYFTCDKIEKLAAKFLFDEPPSDDEN